MVNSYAIIFFLFSAECTKFNRQRQNRYVMLLKLNTVAIFFFKKKNYGNLNPLTFNFKNNISFALYAWLHYIIVCWFKFYEIITPEVHSIIQRKIFDFNSCMTEVRITHSKSVDWFLYDRDLRHERVKQSMFGINVHLTCFSPMFYFCTSQKR